MKSKPNQTTKSGNKESFVCEKIGSINLKNKEKPMTVYAVME